MQKIRTIVDAVSRGLTESRGGASSLISELTDGLDETRDKVDELGDDWYDFVDLAADKTRTLAHEWDQFARDMRSSLEDLDKLPAYRGLFGDASGSAITGKFGGITHGLTTVRQQLFSEFNQLPFGGVLGLLLMGGKYENDANASGARALNVFRRVGSEASSEMKNSVGKTIKDLSVDIDGAEQEISSIFKAMADGGVDLQTATAAMHEPFGKMADEIYTATYAIDNFFRVPAGTTAQLAVKMTQDTGGALGDMVDLVARLGLEAKDSGLSFEQFVGTIGQTSSALRFQQADAEGVARAFKSMREAAKSAYVGADGHDQAQRAVEGMAGLAGGVSNMQIGLQATLAQRIAARLGMRRLDGTDSLLAFNEGFSNPATTGSNKKVDFLTETLHELRALMRETVGDKRGDQYQFLRTVTSFDPNTSKLFMNMSDDMGEIAKLTDEQKTKLLSGLGARKEEKSAQERLLEQILLAIQKLSDLALTSFMSLIRVTVGLGEYLAVKLNPLESALNKQEVSENFDYMTEQVQSRMGDKISAFVDSVKKAGGDGADMLSSLSGPIRLARPPADWHRTLVDGDAPGPHNNPYSPGPTPLPLSGLFPQAMRDQIARNRAQDTVSKAFHVRDANGRDMHVLRPASVVVWEGMIPTSDKE